MQRYYQIKQLSKLVNLNYATVRNWVKYDIVLPAEVMNSSDPKAIYIPESEKDRIVAALGAAKKSCGPRDSFKYLLRTRDDAKHSKCFTVSSICHETGCSRGAAMNAIFKVVHEHPTMTAFDLEYFPAVKAEIEKQKSIYMKKIKTEKSNVIRAKNVVVNVGDLTVSMSDVAARKVMEEISKQLHA